MKRTKTNWLCYSRCYQRCYESFQSLHETWISYLFDDLWILEPFFLELRNNLQFNLSGARAETNSRVSGVDGYETEGIRGLRALGVRDLSYRLVFLACFVAPTNPRVSPYICHVQNLKKTSGCYRS